MERMMRETNLKVKDLPLASFLVAFGLQVTDVEREGRVCHFVFGDRERALTLCKSFWDGSAMVNAKAFSEAQRSLKDLIFSIPN